MQQVFKDLFRYAKKYPAHYITGLVALVVSTYFVTLAPVIVGDAIDSFKEGTMTMRSIWLTLTYLMGAVAAGAMGSLVVRRTILVASYNLSLIHISEPTRPY